LVRGWLVIKKIYSIYKAFAKIVLGVSTKLLNGKLECNGENIDEAKNRYEIYKITLNAFNVEDEPIEEGCY